MEQVTTQTILWIMASFMAIAMAVFGHVYKQLSELRERVEHGNGAEIKEVWQALTDLRREITEDRRAANDSRVRLAENMVTREELDRQVGRLLGELDRHNRMVTGKGIRSDD